MNILFFNRSFYPDTEATGQLLYELCEDLADRGHKITVICGKSYHVNNQENKFLIQKEKYKSIEIIRVIGTTLPKQFLLFRLINLASYFLLAFIGGFLLKQRPDIIITQTDPPVSGLLGIFFSRFYKAKFIYSCKDIYPDIGIVTGKLTNPVLNFLLEKINKLSYELASKIICIGEDMKKKIVSKRINENKIVVIHDWADTVNLCPVGKEENPFRIKNNLDNYFVIMYSGNIGLTQGLEKIINVAEYFKTKKDIKFVFIGEGAIKPKLQEMVFNRKLSNVSFLPYQPKEELKYSLGAGDLHLITFEKGLSGLVVPSKAYGILACGKPFIAWVDKSSEIDIIANKFKCGIAIASGDVTNMIRTIEWAIEHKEDLTTMGANGRRAALEFFDRKISVNAYDKLLQEV